MRTSKANLLIALTLVLGFSGCYGCYAPPSPYACGGAYAACDGYGGYGYGGYDACVDGGFGYGGYPSYCDGGYPPLYEGGYPALGMRDRLSLRERWLARREARALRREGRHDRRFDRRLAGLRHGRNGGMGCEMCCGDCFDCCSSCDWGCCDPCLDCCTPMSSCCSDCGPYMMDGSPCCGASGGFETFESGGVIDGPYTNCADGSCARGNDWQPGSETFVPYSHEGMPAPDAYPSDMTPQPENGQYRETLPGPPNQSEGPWRPSQDDPQIIRPPQAAAPVNQTRWVPPQF